jgi:hypothetical protein
MGIIVGMDAVTGKDLWWRTMGKQYHADTIPRPLVAVSFGPTV